MGDGVLILGFSVSGMGEKSILARGIGPGLVDRGVSNCATNATVTLFNSHGAGLAENGAWSIDAPLINTIFADVGAFSLAINSDDAAVLTTLGEGNYTASIATDAGSSGTALGEIYDATPNAGSWISNASARAIFSLNSPVTAGFVINGGVPKQVLIRVIGPALSNFGITDYLNGPIGIVLDSRGNRIATIGAWGGSPALADLFQQAGAFPLPVDSSDAAMEMALAPGCYSVMVSSALDQSGMVLVELYEL